MADAPVGPVGNVYFELTEAFNARAPTVALASGQAVVYYRVAIMSKDDTLFASEKALPALHVIDRRSLIALKRTQRAKDYAVIAELAAALPPDEEIEVTTDPDRVLALAPSAGLRSSRPAVLAARVGAGNRRAVVVALAEEIDALQQTDRRRVAAYERAAGPYLDACRLARVSTLPLLEAHAQMLDLASRLLTEHVDLEATTDADAE